MNKHEYHPCPHCGRPMVASYAFGAPGGDEIPIGYDCANIPCQQESRREWEEREAAVIRRAIEEDVIDR